MSKYPMYPGGIRGHWEYFTGQEQLDSPIRDQVLATVAATDPDRFTAADVKSALESSDRTADDFAALLSPAAVPLLDEITEAAHAQTRAGFGTTIQLFTPLYIANYCANACIYCGFSARNKIVRTRLTPEGLRAELAAIAATGLKDILILTGESSKFSGVDYVADAVREAALSFDVVGLEVAPVNVSDYASLHEAGADFVSVYQETYDPRAYEPLHPGGRKRSFPYRFDAPERALLGGMRGVGVGALLGLADWRSDALATGLHAEALHRRYPHAEISVSCPRLRPTVADSSVNPGGVGEPELLQILCAYRLFLPNASITVSTRESATFRDRVAGVIANRLSAGVSTGVGTHAEGLDAGDSQFEIADSRSVAEVKAALHRLGLRAA